MMVMDTTYYLVEFGLGIINTMYKKSTSWKHIWLHEDGSVDVVPDGNHLNFVYESKDLNKFHINDDDYTIVRDVIENSQPSDDAMKRLLEHNYRIGVFGNEFYIESKAVDTRTLKFLQNNIPMNEIGSVARVSWDAPFMTTAPVKTSLDEFLNAKSVRDLSMNTFANLIKVVNRFQKDATLLERNSNSVNELKIYVSELEKTSNIDIRAGVKEKIIDLVKNVFGDWDAVTDAIEDYKVTEGDKEAKAESADKYPSEIDFSFYEGPDLRFNSTTSEYELLNDLEEDAWVEYLDEMGRYGVTVEYDTIEDEFVVSVSLGKDAGIIDKAKVWLIITLIATLLGTTASEVLADPITMVNRTITTVEGDVTRIKTEGKIDKIDRYEDKMVFHFYSPADSQTKRNLAESYLKYQKAMRLINNFNFIDEGQGNITYSIS